MFRDEVDRRKRAGNFDCYAFLDITTCLVSFLHRQCQANRRLGAFIGWRLAGSIDGSKNNWYLPRFSTLPRNKVHFHGITISGNWHLQQHRDALWSSTRPISYFRTGSMPGRDAGRKLGPGDACESQMCFIQQRHPFAFQSYSEKWLWGWWRITKRSHRQLANNPLPNSPAKISSNYKTSFIRWVVRQFWNADVARFNGLDKITLPLNDNDLLHILR